MFCYNFVVTSARAFISMNVTYLSDKDDESVIAVESIDEKRAYWKKQVKLPMDGGEDREDYVLKLKGNHRMYFQLLLSVGKHFPTGIEQADSKGARWDSVAMELNSVKDFKPANVTILGAQCTAQWKKLVVEWKSRAKGKHARNQTCNT